MRDPNFDQVRPSSMSKKILEEKRIYLQICKIGGSFRSSVAFLTTYRLFPRIMPPWHLEVGRETGREGALLCGKRKTDQPLEMDLVPSSSSSSKANAPEEGRGGGQPKSSARPMMAQVPQK